MTSWSAPEATARSTRRCRGSCSFPRQTARRSVAKKLIHKRFELWCLAAITGGAIGNLIDRVQTGLVVDMICIPWFSTFNVADIFITFGAIILVLYILIKDKEFLEDKPKKAKEPRDEA